jgi:hypothetical protein
MMAKGRELFHSVCQRNALQKVTLERTAVIIAIEAH